MIACRYGISFLVLISTSDSFAASTRELSSQTLEEKFLIYTRPFSRKFYKVLHNQLLVLLRMSRYGESAPIASELPRPKFQKNEIEKFDNSMSWDHQKKNTLSLIWPIELSSVPPPRFKGEVTFSHTIICSKLGFWATVWLQSLYHKNAISKLHDIM